MNNALDEVYLSAPAKRWGRISLIYLALLAYFWSFSKYGLNIWDEGGYANGTLRTLNGERALIDFNPNGYLPGRYWYGMVFFKLFGIEIQSLRLGVLLITPPMILMLYSIGRKIMPAGFALLAALFMLSAPSMYYNRFFTFFVILNLYLIINVLKKKNLTSLAGFGVGIFLSAFFKFEVTLFSILISLVMFALVFSQKHLRFFSQKNSAHVVFKNYYLISGIYITAIIFLVYLGQDGYFTKVFKMVIDAHEVWGNPFPEILPFIELLKDGVVTETIHPGKPLYFEKLLPARYEIRLIVDSNKDGKWTAGNYFDNVLPEKVYYYPELINLRANWELEVDWEINP